MIRHLPAVVCAVAVIAVLFAVANFLAHDAALATAWTFIAVVAFMVAGALTYTNPGSSDE